jgi:hypothetical protein
VFQVLTELSIQALGMLPGLSIEHVMAMLDTYQACDWMPGEPLKSQLMRILEKVHANTHTRNNGNTGIHASMHTRVHTSAHGCVYAPADVVGR